MAATFRLLRESHQLSVSQAGRTGTKIFIDTGGLLDEPQVGDVFDATDANLFLTARQIVKVPYGNNGSNDLFKHTVEYSTSPVQDGEEDGGGEEEKDSEDLANNGDMSSEWLELTPETVGHEWTWLSDGGVITNKRIRRRVIRQSLRITQTRNDLDFPFWRTKLGNVNNAAFRGIPAEGWLFVGAPWREIRRSDGKKAFRFDLRFEMKQIEDANNLGTFFGWNHAYRAEQDAFDKPRDSNNNLIHLPTAYEGVGEIFG